MAYMMAPRSGVQRASLQGERSSLLYSQQRLQGALGMPGLGRSYVEEAGR